MSVSPHARRHVQSVGDSKSQCDAPAINSSRHSVGSLLVLQVGMAGRGQVRCGFGEVGSREAALVEIEARVQNELLSFAASSLYSLPTINARSARDGEVPSIR